jgi:ATP-dependent DNA helicase RecG
VQVTVRRRIIKPEIIDFIAKADQTYQLTQRERIVLGLLAQHDALTARELAQALELSSVESLNPWIKRPLEWRLVLSVGRTQATRYFIDPQLLRSLDFSVSTTLRRIEPHRLAALVLEDLQRYPESAISDIHQRVGAEIHSKQVKRALDELIERGDVRFEGNNRWRRYWAVDEQPIGQ